MLNIVKKQIRGLLHTLIGAGTEIKAVIEGQNEAALVNVLADAQDAAAAMGNKVEAESLGEDEKLSEEEQDRARIIISLLEKFCELLWQITQAQDMQAQLLLTSRAWEILEEAGQALEQIPEQMTVVFMPYKASMWDCMESVWQAACEDPDCVPFVMPIPYFDLQDGKVSGRHYEGDRFPPYVPVVDYSAFPLEELHPDVIFVHNPFDDCNIVTSVLPQFFSAELKKIAKCLVYIPYYITGDGVFVTHRYLPAYENMDYIVTQCERTIDSFSSDLSREKFLPFGSPIADRVLRLEKEKPDIPEEWKAQLKNGKDFGDDRVVMLNTSISLLMKQKDRFLDKIEYLFDLAKEKKGITLVWRPHPLLTTSAQTMGETYAARLSGLEEKFLGEKIGVLDRNPDVGVTVALCDAYLGETASSVIHMFGIAGKPRFYINLQIPDTGQGEHAADDAGKRERNGCENRRSCFCQDRAAEYAEGNRKTPEEDRGNDLCMESIDGGNGRADSAGRQDGKAEIPVSAWCCQGNREYYVLEEGGWILERETGSERFRPLVRIPGRDTVWGRAYKGMEAKGETLWVYPENAEGIFVYEIKTGRMRKVFQNGTEKDGGPVSRNESDCCGEPRLLQVDDGCLSMIRAEKFKRGNAVHVWSENEVHTLDDFFRFLQTAEDSELTGIQGGYSTWLANLDGSCGGKVLQAVKESVLGNADSRPCSAGAAVS